MTAEPDVPTSSTTNVDGSTIGGSVTTNGGDVVGRDKYIFQFSQIYQQTHVAVDATQLAAALTEYLKWLKDSTQSIELRGIPARGNVVSLSLDEIFVPLRAEIAEQRRRQADPTIALDQVLTVGEQLAVIGGPGSGKSTVLQYIAWVLATALLNNDGQWATQKLGLRLVGDDALPPLPLYLPLSAYARLHFHSGDLVGERDGYYRFIHLAFQEYLAARHLAEVYWRDEGIKGTMRFLAAQTPDSWWREVATLLPGYLREALPPHAKRVLYALAGGHDGSTDWQAEAAQWSPDIQLAAAEIAATAALEWFDEDDILRQQLVDRLLHFFNNPDLLNQTEPRLRALAGRALAALGDPRFRQDAWYLPNDPMLGFIEMPAGTFTMGEGRAAHEVTLPDFYIARWPVTVAQFRAYVAATGERLRYADGLNDPNNHPMRYINWHEATRYCVWLTETLRNWAETPTALAEKLHDGWQVMLPSEAEWERVARGLTIPELVEGTVKPRVETGRFYPWEGHDLDSNRANYKATGIGTTSAVGCFPAGATPKGVEELSGNVRQWTRSLYLEYPYPSDEQGCSERERFKADDMERFVLRGGSFYEGDQNMRAPARDHSRAVYLSSVDYGFRLVLGAAPRQLAL